MTATRSDGGGDIAVLAVCRCSRRVPLLTAPPQPRPARDGCPTLSESWGVGEGGGRGPAYVSWAALRLDTFQMCLLNLADQAAATQVSKPVVEYLIRGNAVLQLTWDAPSALLLVPSRHG